MITHKGTGHSFVLTLGKQITCEPFFESQMLGIINGYPDMVVGNLYYIVTHTKKESESLLSHEDLRDALAIDNRIRGFGLTINGVLSK